LFVSASHTDYRLHMKVLELQCNTVSEASNWTC